MSALPDHYTTQSKGINWLSHHVAVSMFTAEMAFERIGLPNPEGVIGHFSLFNRLPDLVLTSDLSPAAKLIYADIFSWCYTKDKSRKPVVKEYFFGHRKIADDRIGMSRQGVTKAINELVEGGWIGNTEKAYDSNHGRLKLMPLNTKATSDVATKPEAPGPGTSDDSDDSSQGDAFDDLEALGPGTSDAGVATLEADTTRPGVPMPYAVARRLTMVPLFLGVMELRKANIIRIPEVLVYGLMVKLAKPFYYASDIRTAEATGLHRETVKRARQRLEHLRMISVSDHGYYITAHPILNDQAEAKKQFNYLGTLIKQEDRND